jgi:Maltose acetyltransferase
MPPSSPEWNKALRGELYHAFVPELVAARDRCKQACDFFNKSDDMSRRRMVQLWREYVVPDPWPVDPASILSFSMT